MAKETFQSFEMMMRNLSVRCLFGNMEVEKLGKDVRNFGFRGLNTKTTTSPRPPLFGASVFLTGAIANPAIDLGNSTTQNTITKDEKDVWTNN